MVKEVFYYFSISLILKGILIDTEICKPVLRLRLFIYIFPTNPKIAGRLQNPWAERNT